MLQLYIANCAKPYMGEWVDFPCYNLDEVFDRIDVYKLDEYGTENEPFCADFESNIPGFRTMYSEYPNYDEMNRIAELGKKLDQLSDDERTIVGGHITEWNEDLETAMVHADQGRVWTGCKNMTDVARDYIEEMGGLKNIPDAYKYCFDFQGIERDLIAEGCFNPDDYFDVEEVVQEYFASGADIPGIIAFHFNYAQFGNDLRLEGTFITDDNGDMVELWS